MHDRETMMAVYCRITALIGVFCIVAAFIFVSVAPHAAAAATHQVSSQPSASPMSR